RRAVRALWRVARANPVQPQAPGGAAAHAHRAAHRRRPVAHRRGGGGDRRRVGGRPLPARVSHRRGRLPSHGPAHVRGVAAVGRRGHRDLLCAVARLAPHPAPLARKRGAGGDLAPPPERATMHSSERGTWAMSAITTAPYRVEAFNTALASEN